ncbi:phosphatidylglycerol lysyltransferase domain-containing protein [Fodinicola acaciae]|uniref:phosphatidylglycerol lysyltransferase domain-containing protein n=1 Tax=Fodinicola acaciae TaxID=2681555 RepID=UPI0013D5D357|nr:phosphatidylglycerol lysyltransferase domain-containing protein [Fodinicola acaciae]
MPLALAALSALYGLISIWSAVLPRSRAHLRVLSEFIPKPVTFAAIMLAIAAGIVLVLLAHGLRRRKKRAWRLAVAISAVLIVTHLSKGFGFEAAVLAALLLALLIYARAEFIAKGDRSTRWIAVGAVVVIYVVGFLAGMLAIGVYHRRGYRPTMLESAWTVLTGFVGLDGTVPFRNDKVANMVGSALVGVTVLAIIIGAYLLLRPLEPKAYLTDDDSRRLRELLDRFGARDSLGYFALRTDKSVVWSPTGKAAVPYRVVAGVALASGDPIGDPEAWPGAIKPFLELCREYAWLPAVIGCSEQGGTVYAREAGLHVLEIGDEAVVQVADFSLSGRSMRNVRQTVNRVKRAGYVARVRRLAELTQPETAELARVAAAWRGAETERGFSMALGRFGDLEDGDCVVVTAHTVNEDGEQLRALLNFVPWGPDGLSLDLMRRDREADGGLNEFLICSLLEKCPELRVKRVSLNFAMFRSALARGEKLGAGPISRGWSKMLTFASRWWQIESLYRFNEKFAPVWIPRFVCYPSAGSLIPIAMAAMEAEAFWTRPAAIRRLAGRVPLGFGERQAVQSSQ